MNPRLIEAAKLFLTHLHPGETLKIHLVPAGQVVAPGRVPQRATVIVTVPMITSEATATVASLAPGDLGLS